MSNGDWQVRAVLNKGVLHVVAVGATPDDGSSFSFVTEEHINGTLIVSVVLVPSSEVSQPMVSDARAVMEYDVSDKKKVIVQRIDHGKTEEVVCWDLDCS